MFADISKTLFLYRNVKLTIVGQYTYCHTAHNLCAYKMGNSDILQ